MDRRLFLVAVLATGSAAAAAPGPDPRLEQQLSMNVIGPIERSVQFEKAIPQVQAPARPVVDHGRAVEVRKDVYVDRGLVPPPRGTGSEDAIRVYPREPR